MPWAQLLFGPPGSGKTTFADGMQQFLGGLGRRPVLVNLDPANDSLPYDCDIDIADLICLEEVMKSLSLGPNGGMMYCIEYLEKNLDWLQEKLEAAEGNYFIIDCPGQVELYTMHESMRRIVTQLQKWDYRVTGVHLVDAYHCSDAAKFVSVVMLSLSTMMQLELPHINILSKVDLMESMGDLDFNLEFYTEVLDLNYLLDRICAPPSRRDRSDSLGKGRMDEDGKEDGEEEEEDEERPPSPTAFQLRFRRLNELLIEVLEDYPLVAFHTLNIMDKASVARIVRAIDKTNGYYGPGMLDDDLAAYISSVEGRPSTMDDEERYLSGVAGSTGLS